MIQGRFQEYSDTYAKFGIKKKDRVRKTNKIDLSDVQNTAPVHIFMAGDDRVCPVTPLDLLQEFNYPQPAVETYKGWQHNDFVTGADLDRLVSDIHKATLGKRKAEGDQRLNELYSEL